MAKDWWIKLDVGAWEKDVNTISIEAEGALLKLTFKLTDSQDRGRFTFALDSLCKLFKTSPESAKKIILELQRNNILDITYKSDFEILIESRRILKEAMVSKKNSINGSKGGRGRKSQIKANLKPKESEPFTTYSNSSFNSDERRSQEEENEKQFEFDPEYCGLIMSQQNIDQSTFDHMLKQFWLKKQEDGTVYDNIKQAKAGFQKWVNSWIRNEKVAGTGITIFNDRNPEARRAKTVQEKIMSSYGKK